MNQHLKVVESWSFFGGPPNIYLSRKIKSLFSSQSQMTAFSKVHWTFLGHHVFYFDQREKRVWEIEKIIILGEKICRCETETSGVCMTSFTTISSESALIRLIIPFIRIGNISSLIRLKIISVIT